MDGWIIQRRYSVACSLILFSFFMYIFLLVFSQTQLMYKWIEPKICNENAEGAVNLPASGEMQTCPPCNPGFFTSNSSACQPCPQGFYSNGTGVIHKQHTTCLYYKLQFQVEVKLIDQKERTHQKAIRLRCSVVFTACTECPAGTEPVMGFEYKWWNRMPSNMNSSVYRREYSGTQRSTGKQSVTKHTLFANSLTLTICEVDTIQIY